MAAITGYTLHLFASLFQKPQSPATTTPTSTAVPILTSPSPIFERNNNTQKNFHATHNPPSFLTLILPTFLPFFITLMLFVWHGRENIMSGKEKAERKKKKKKSQRGTIQATVDHDIVPPPRDDHPSGSILISGNDSKNDKMPKNPNRCSETGKLKPSIPIPNPFPVPWLPIFIPPLDAADAVADNRQGSTDPAANHHRPSATILRLLSKTHYFIPQLDEQMVGPSAVRQSLADWELALRTSGVGGTALPRPLPIMSSMMRDAFVYCDSCELTWLVGQDDCHVSGNNRVRHPVSLIF